MTTAQLIFSIALGFITLLITVFAIYVVSTTFWADRWSARKSPNRPTDIHTGGEIER